MLNRKYKLKHLDFYTCCMVTRFCRNRGKILIILNISVDASFIQFYRFYCACFTTLLVNYQTYLVIIFSLILEGEIFMPNIF